MTYLDTWEGAFDACINALEDPHRSWDDKSDARGRLRQLGRRLDALEQSGWDDLDGDIRESFFPDEE